MKVFFRIFVAIIVLIIAGYYFLGYLSSFVVIGKLRYRVGSTDITESIKRGVFVKKLNYKVDSFPKDLANFQPFIEKGYRFGKGSSAVIEPLNNSDYPYQLSFNYRPNADISVLIRSDELEKFDSANTAWGYLKLPHLKDTIVLVVNGKGGRLGTIKVWENKNENVRAGSICTVETGDGKFGVIKVLVINDKETHIKIYKNQYDTRPSIVDITTLTLGSINDTDGFGIGHIPLDRKRFDNWKPVIIGYQEVSKSELEGYEMWKNQ